VETPADALPAPNEPATAGAPGMLTEQVELGGGEITAPVESQQEESIPPTP
jgi:hypothetical protein